MKAFEEKVQEIMKERYAWRDALIATKLREKGLRASDLVSVERQVDTHFVFTIMTKDEYLAEFGEPWHGRAEAVPFAELDKIKDST